MDPSITAALIGIFGTAAIGGLGLVFTGLRTGIRDNGMRIGGLEERVGGLEERVGRFEERTISEFGQIKDVLARIEATQQDHGRLLADHGHQLADHGRLLEKLAGDDAS